MLLFPGWSGVVGQTQDEVRGDLVELGKLDEKLRGDVPLAGFVELILGLRQMKKLGDLPLRQVAVLPQIPYALIVTHGASFDIRLNVLTIAQENDIVNV